MVEQERLKRRGRMEAEISHLAYERFKAGRTIENLQKQMAVIGLQLTKLEGGLQENEKARIDLATQAAIDAAPKEQEGN